MAVAVCFSRVSSSTRVARKEYFTTRDIVVD